MFLIGGGQLVPETVDNVLVTVTRNLQISQLKNPHYMNIFSSLMKIGKKKNIRCISA